MKKMFSCKVRLQKIFVFCLTVLFLFGAVSEAGHYLLKDLADSLLFTDPSEIQQMPSDWKKQPVKYDADAEGADIVITMDQQMYPALLPIIQEYAENHGLKIVIDEGSCGITAGKLIRKAVDIGGYCCTHGLMDRLPGLRFHTLGIAPLALLVHPDNPIDDITIEQAQHIFQGEIYRWSELRTISREKGPNLPIQPVGRLHCKLRHGHWRSLLDNEDIFSPSLREVGAIPDMISLVSANQGAIGYETIWEVRHHRDKGKVKMLKINGYCPKKLSHLLSGRYPLYRVYSLTTWEGKGVSNPRAQKLVDYLMQQVKKLDSKFGVIPASRLRQAGWKFDGNDLIGEPTR